MQSSMTILTMLALLACSTGAAASDLVYTPNNPSFGGNPLNGSYLLNKAIQQNSHEKSIRSPLGLSRNPIEDFEESLARRLLSALSGEIVDSMFGDGNSDLPDGPFTIGDLEIVIDSFGGSGPAQITITDLLTGEQTIIVLPDLAS